ncbi:MAG: TonB family protein [Acidobacteriota bacterium]
MDAVGQIIANRQHEDFPWAAGGSLAILLHAGVGLALLASSLSSPKRFVPGRTLAVRLQSAGSLRGHAVDLAPAPAPAAAEPEKPKILKPPDEIPPPPSEKAKLLPAREDPKKNPPLPAFSDPIGKSKVPASGHPSTGAPAPSNGSAGTGSGSGNGAGAGVGGLTFDQPGFNYPYYYERVKIAIETNWFKPATSIPTSPVVHFTIQRDGTISDAEVVTSSGLPFVDRAALRAVLASSPLPPLPSEFQSNRVGLSVLFE